MIFHGSLHVINSLGFFVFNVCTVAKAAAAIITVVAADDIAFVSQIFHCNRLGFRYCNSYYLFPLASLLNQVKLGVLEIAL